MRDPRQLYRAVYHRLTLKTNSGTIGMGLIGVGGWGASNAIHIMQSRRFHIIGVYDIRGECRSQFADQFNTKCYDQIDELVAEPRIQAVCITVPNQFHADLVKDMADAHKHIFIEKPLASYPHVCRELGQYCRERHVTLMVGHQMRREPVFREIKRILNNGCLGRPLFVQGVSTLDRRSRADWRWDPGACPGGSMEQLGVHLIDVLISLFGRPKDACGWSENIPVRPNAPDWRYVLLSFDHDLHAAISTSFSSSKHLRLEFFFERGRLVTDGRSFWITQGSSQSKRVMPKGVRGSVAQFVEFADCIELGQRPETDADAAAAVMDAVSRIHRSPET